MCVSTHRNLKNQEVLREDTQQGVRKLAPGKNELYPAWQGMQYMRNMMDKRATLNTINNNRYGDMKWTKVKDLLSTYKVS